MDNQTLLPRFKINAISSYNSRSCIHSYVVFVFFTLRTPLQCSVAFISFQQTARTRDKLIDKSTLSLLNHSNDKKASVSLHDFTT